MKQEKESLSVLKRNLADLFTLSRVVAEAITVIALLVIALLYNLKIFWLVIVPAMCLGILISHRRLMFLFFHYWPAKFTK